jgi:hypothetical protein
LRWDAARQQRNQHDAGPAWCRLFFPGDGFEQTVVADRYDAGVGGMVMVALDMISTVRMRMPMPVAVIVFIVFDVEMRRSVHIQVHRSQDLKGHDQRQKPGDCATRPVRQRFRVHNHMTDKR